MHSDEDKDLVMANLKELKGKEQYKGVRISDDYYHQGEKPAKGVGGES